MTTDRLILDQLDVVRAQVRHALRELILEPEDQDELLRMLNEVSRFVTVPVPEQVQPPVPF